MLPFKISDNAVTEDEATQIANSIVKALLDCGVSIVDRGSLEDILEELQFQSLDWSNLKKTAELGKILNAHIIIKGRVSNDSGSHYFYSGNFKIGPYSIIGKANLEVARKMAKEYQNGDIGGWHLMTLDEFARLRELGIFERSGEAWSVEKGMSCIVG